MTSNDEHIVPPGEPEQDSTADGNNEEPIAANGGGAASVAAGRWPDPASETLHSSGDLMHYQVFPVGDSFFRSRVPRSTHWSVAWSDLMMTMFIFFVVLFAYQAAQPDFLTGEGPGSDIGTEMGSGILGEGGGGGTESAALPAVQVGPNFSDLSQLIETEEAITLREFASVELAPDRTVRIILTGDLFFDVGQATVKAQAREQLVKIAELIRRTPNMVNVIGHTDNIPMRSARFASNWELSVVRATAVTRFLIEEMKLPGSRFYVSGHSYYQPVAPNTTAANRAANRRVEIVITKEAPQATPGTIGDIL